jgi:lysozyme family protein
MADFLPAVALTLQHEGGYVDNDNDKGGPTNMGITSKDMPDVNLKIISVEQAQEFYRKKFWNPLFQNIISQDMANKIFDMGVLFGMSTAARLAQSVLLAAGSVGIHKTDVFDASTLAGVNGLGSEKFLPAYKSRFSIHARWIPTQDPTQEEFVNGWVNRISS